MLSPSCTLGHQEGEERLGDSTGWRRGSGTVVGHSARAGCLGCLWVWGRGAGTREAALGGGAGVREAILGWGHDAESGEMLLSVAGWRRWVLGTSGCALQCSRGRARATAKGWAGMADLVWGRGAGPVSCQTYWGGWLREARNGRGAGGHQHVTAPCSWGLAPSDAAAPGPGR